MERRVSSITFAFALLLTGLVSTPARADFPAEVESFWKDGDRVVLIGDTLIERDQKYGYLETSITAQNPDKTITFRNLGWSGDTVRGLSRSGFGPPAEGWTQLKDHVLALKPTVLIVGYGMAESFEGEPGLASFVSGYNSLLDTFSPLKPRLILLSPITHEDLGRPLPDPTAHRRDLALYRNVVEKIANERKAVFIDLFGRDVGDGMRRVLPHPQTDDGIHLNAFGSWQFGQLVNDELSGQLQMGWVVEVTRPGSPVRPEQEKQAKTITDERTTLSNLQRTTTGLRFETLDQWLARAINPAGTPREFLPEDRYLSASGLDTGTYVLTVDGKEVARATDREWAKGIRIHRVPEREQVEALRVQINLKNELYFYRWRPQNETYLFGFRKHEQGNNAREIPRFDPLVEAKEKEIARLKKPVPHVYELTRDDKKS